MQSLCGITFNAETLFQLMKATSRNSITLEYWNIFIPILHGGQREKNGLHRAA